MIDLRSDTLTKPSKEMLEAMLSAEVGDDVFGEDPTTNKLQEVLADMFGMESSLFVSSGVMVNQLAIKSLTEPGDEVIVESQSHIFYYETAAPSIVSSVQLKPVSSENGHMNIDDIEKAIRPGDYYFPKSKLICIENTHNRHSGSIIGIDYVKELSSFAKSKNLLLHMDGARLWNSISATGTKPKDWSVYFDTISVCLSKGLGAPVGSVLMGAKDKITKAHRWRKILGGGMRQTGILAAAGLYAIKNNFDALAEDHLNAKFFAKGISESPSIIIDIPKVQTNIVCFDLKESVDINKFLDKCKNDGLLMLPFGPKTVRAVFHYHIDRKLTEQAVGYILKNVSS